VKRFLIADASGKETVGLTLDEREAISYGLD
jgi:hypothetical protein